MSSPEPLTPERFEAIRAMRLITGLNAYCGHYDTDAERELYVEAVKHYNARIELVAQVEWMAAELADARREVERLTVARAELTVWRAEFSTIPLGTYLDRDDAQASCVAHYRTTCGIQPLLSWGEDQNNPDCWTLWAREDASSEDDETSYTVTPLFVQAAFDPDGDE